MCGRYARRMLPESYEQAFDIYDVASLPSYNVAPTQDVVAVRMDDGHKQCAVLRWGLIPSWAKDKKMSFINARGDSVFEKPAFRAAVKRRRCLILADGYYEWKTEGKKKHPFYFRLKKDEPFAFAGVWERWDKGESPIESCAIITTDANELSRAVHDRMPVMLRRPEADAWIDPAIEDPTVLKELLRPFPAELMTYYAVEPLVNNVKNNAPECLNPVAELKFD